MILGYAEQWGKKLAVDFGFGTFLEKVEEHFGPRVLKVLLILIGLAVALFCGKLIWDTAIGPLITILSRAVASGGFIVALVNIFWIAMAITGGMGLASLILANIMKWGIVKQATLILEDAKRLNAKIAQDMKVAQQTLMEVDALQSSKLDQPGLKDVPSPD